MDLGLSQEQNMLRMSARNFFEKECPMTLVRGMEEDERGYSPELWLKMVELGWMGVVIPEEHGGIGGNFLDLMVLLEEMGRVLLPGPFFSTVVLGALPILAAGTTTQKEEFLPKIANGEMILTLALTEISARHDAAGIEVRAAAEGDDYIITGTKLFVQNAHVSDYLVCATRTRDGASPEEGITLFLVDSKNPGISRTILETIAADKQCEVIFDNVRIPGENILGELDKGWSVLEKITQQAAVATCALMLGGAYQVIKMTVAYAKERVQFGRPIGSFQAIQHKCADMATEIDGARYIAYQAAWKISECLPSAMEVSMAKAWVSEAYRRTCRQGHQIHGGIGFTEEHNMGLYFRRAKAMEVAFGDADYHRELVAQQIDL